MERNKFMFYDNFLEAIEQLPESERANACYRFCKYALNNELPDDKGLAMFCIGVRYSVQKFSGRGGKREGAGRHKKNQDGNQDDFPLENGWGGKRDGAGRPKSPENREEKSSSKNQNNQNNQKSQTETETKTETKRDIIEKNQVCGGFVPPTEEEVLNYARQMHECRDVMGFYCSKDMAKRFYLHYETQNWLLGNGNHMTNWKVGLKKWAFDELKNQKDEKC